MATIALGPNTAVSGATGGKPLDGDKPLLVLVHGAGMDRTVWALQTRWLAHHDRCVLAVDLPGHGGSTEPERTSVADYAEWIAGIVEGLDRPVHLAGHSMGSFVVLEAALRADVASATLIGTAAAMPVHPALLDAARANDPLASKLMSGWAFAAANRTGAHPSPGSSMVGGTQALIAQARPGVLHNDLAMCADYTTAVETATKVTAPLHFLLGALDKMTPVRQAQPLIDAASNPSVTVVAHSGHMLTVEAPVQTRQRLHDVAAEQQ